MTLSTASPSSSSSTTAALPRLLVVFFLFAVCCCCLNKNIADASHHAEATATATAAAATASFFSAASLERAYRSRCVAKQRSITTSTTRAATILCPTGGKEDCYLSDPNSCISYTCQRGSSNTCVGGTPITCAHGADEVVQCSNFGNDCNAVPASDTALLVRCTVSLQREYCGQPSSAQYVGCVRSNYPKCFEKNELNAQQERWVTRIMEISDGCKTCSDELIMSRRRVLSGFANSLPAAAVPKSTSLSSKFDDVSDVRNALEVKLCQERNMISTNFTIHAAIEESAKMFEPIIFGAESQLRKDFGQCVAQKTPVRLTIETREMRKQCVAFLKNVLAVDHVFGKNYINFF